jgi:hypothetical protein
MMHGHEKSRSAIVAVKPTNKAERSAAESVERRAETKGNVDQQRTRRTQRRISVSQMLARIRQHIVAVDTQGGNRMRESCTYGSVRGVRGNSHPYRAVQPFVAAQIDNHSEDRFGSKARITAPQHRCPLHLNERISASATLSVG